MLLVLELSATVNYSFEHVSGSSFLSFLPFPLPVLYSSYYNMFGFFSAIGLLVTLADCACAEETGGCILGF